MKKVNNNNNNKKTISNRHRYFVTETNEKKRAKDLEFGFVFLLMIFNQRTIQRKIFFFLFYSSYELISPFAITRWWMSAWWWWWWWWWWMIMRTTSISWTIMITITITIAISWMLILLFVLFSSFMMIIKTSIRITTKTMTKIITTRKCPLN